MKAMKARVAPMLLIRRMYDESEWLANNDGDMRRFRSRFVYMAIPVLADMICDYD